MDRMTIKEIKSKIEFIEKYGFGEIELNRAYGKQWVSITKRSGISLTSPILTKSGLWDWLQAFEYGIEYSG